MIGGETVGDHYGDSPPDLYLRIKQRYGDAVEIGYRWVSDFIPQPDNSPSPVNPEPKEES